MSKRLNKTIKWDKLDNTANLFPVIVSENVSNVYRISVTLTEDIDAELLQKALDKILPFFDVFNHKLKNGIFWYYFEANNQPAPRVIPEDTYPCLYINPYTNNEYLFRVTYYQKRINLEVFHVLTDGNGALIFLKELTYQYLRYKYPELAEKAGNTLNADSSLDIEDSYKKNYIRPAKRSYKTEKAVILKGEKLPFNHFAILHGYIPVAEIKQAAAKYGVTINQYLLGTFTWAIYKEYLKGQPSKRPISTVVPVNLRPYFNSNTTKNFFAVVSAYFKPEKDTYTFEDVLHIIADRLKEQINNENLEKLLSYNVSNEKLLIARVVPLFLKNLPMKYVYTTSALANTAPISIIGNISVPEEYRPYVEMFHAFLAMSKGQHLKGTICSYGDTLVFSFRYDFVHASLPRRFFRLLSSDVIAVELMSNVVHYD